MLPRLPFFFAFWTLHAQSFINISTRCHRIHSVFPQLPKHSKFSKIAKQSTTTITQCCGPSRSWYKWLCLSIMDPCFFCRIPATHNFFNLLKILNLGCSLVLANFFKENSICLGLIGAVLSAPPKSDKSSLSKSALCMF
jgi:hypothetical protein